MLTPYRPSKAPSSAPQPPMARPEPDDTQALVPHHAATAVALRTPAAKPPQPFQVLEVTIISAQDLSSAARTMPTYAVAWVHPAHKLTTRVDNVGRVNPTWNEKFVFRVDEEFLTSETSAVMIHIYGSCRYRRDPLIGTVRLVLSSFKPSSTTRFAALQVRRPSSLPQGILNVGVVLLDGYTRTMPLYSTVDVCAFAYKDLMGAAQPPEDAAAAAGDQGLAAGAKGEDMLTRSGSVVVRPWGDDREQEMMETKLERWRAELPPPATVDQLRRAVGEEDEINISERGKLRRKGRRSWSTGALSCFCEVRRHHD